MTGDEAGLELSLVGVTRRFGVRTAVDAVSLDVVPGSTVALMGPNGSGKTTLLRLMSGRDVPSEGEVRLGGRRFSEDEEWVRRQVALVAEDSAFYPDLTVREHLWLVACAHGGGDQSTAMTDDALAELRLTDHADAFPRELSSGQQQALLLSTVLVRPRSTDPAGRAGTPTRSRGSGPTRCVAAGRARRRGHGGAGDPPSRPCPRRRGPTGAAGAGTVVADGAPDEVDTGILDTADAADAAEAAGAAEVWSFLNAAIVGVAALAVADSPTWCTSRSWPRWCTAGRFCSELSGR